MNIAQKVVLTFGAILATCMGLSPPWSYTLNAVSVSRSKPAGYSFILSPPEPENDAPGYGVRLDISRIVFQWIVVSFATGAGTAMCYRRDVGGSPK